MDVPMFSVLVMRWMRDLADINHRKKDEDESLNEGDEQSKRHQEHRNAPVSVGRLQARNALNHLLISEHVAEETDAERHRAHQITDEFDDEQQRRNRQHRPHEVFEVAEQPVLFDADVVVINE